MNMTRAAEVNSQAVSPPSIFMAPSLFGLDDRDCHPCRCPSEGFAGRRRCGKSRGLELAGLAGLLVGCRHGVRVLPGPGGNTPLSAAPHRRPPIGPGSSLEEPATHTNQRKPEERLGLQVGK